MINLTPDDIFLKNFNCDSLTLFSACTKQENRNVHLFCIFIPYVLFSITFLFKLIYLIHCIYNFIKSQYAAFNILRFDLKYHLIEFSYKFCFDKIKFCYYTGTYTTCICNMIIWSSLKCWFHLIIFASILFWIKFLYYIDENKIISLDCGLNSLTPLK